MATQSESINTNVLINLCRYDPPKFGWAATGGIVDLLPPIEVRTILNINHKYNKI